MNQVWVALLRGINVGGRNAVPMAGLRSAFEEAGCRDVRTYIASGNVVFTKRASDRGRLARLLERTVDETFGVPAVVVLRTGEELRKLVRSKPFGADTSGAFVTFLAEKPDAKAVRSLKETDFAPDELEVAGTEVFLRYPNGLAKAQLTSAMLERKLGVAGTNRNWRTVVRVAELAEKAAGG
jgi:uncharacterized protein (DUF1697 family)